MGETLVCMVPQLLIVFLVLMGIDPSSTRTLELNGEHLRTDLQDLVAHLETIADHSALQSDHTRVAHSSKSLPANAKGRVFSECRPNAERIK